MSNIVHNRRSKQAYENPKREKCVISRKTGYRTAVILPASQNLSPSYIL